MSEAPPGAECRDAVIVGGGPAGSAAAIALARAGRRVLLVERRANVDFKLGESIPPQARTLVEDLLGRADGLRTQGNVSCWGGPEPITHNFVFTPNGHGLRLDRPRFDRALRERAEQAGAEILADARVDAIETGAAWRLLIAGDSGTERVQARCLIDCSGRRAYVARSRGAQVVEGDRLFAFARSFELPAGHEADADTLTRIEAAAHGWWYTVRLPDARRLVVFHTDRDLPAAQMAAGEDGFDALLGESRHVASLLAEQGYRAVGRPRGAAASSQRLDRFTSSQGLPWLAAGDAAQAFDPLSSQGIKTALESGFLAGASVDRILGGDAAALKRYGQAQEAVQAEYLRHHRHYYNTERRWLDQPFWQRRQSRAPMPARPREERPCATA